MSVTSGFYDSDASTPRLYTAEEFGSIFDGLISDGVYQWYGNKFEVTKISGSPNVNVGTGRAWFNHTWTLNDSLYTIENYPQAHPVYDRNDVVAIKVDKTSRQNSIVLCKGVENEWGSTNVPVDTATVFYYPIANILVPHGATNSNSYTITSLIGQGKTKWVYTIIENAADITEYLNQYQTQVTAELATLRSSIEAWQESIDAMLEDDVATNLSNAITQLSNDYHIFVTQTFSDVRGNVIQNQQKISALESGLDTVEDNFYDKFPYYGSGTSIDAPPCTICRFGSAATGTKPNLGTGWILVITGLLDASQASNIQLAMSPTSNKIALRRKKNASSWYQWRYLEFTT